MCLFIVCSVSCSYLNCEKLALSLSIANKTCVHTCTIHVRSIIQFVEMKGKERQVCSIWCKCVENAVKICAIIELTQSSDERIFRRNARHISVKCSLSNCNAHSFLQYREHVPIIQCVNPKDHIEFAKYLF